MAGPALGALAALGGPRVPFFVAALLVGAVKCYTRHESPAETLFGLLWATGQTLPWSHLWFLPTLFLALLVTQLLGYVIGERVSRWAVAASVFLWSK